MAEQEAWGVEPETTVDPAITAAGEELLAARDRGDEERIADILDRSGVDLAHSAYAGALYDAATALPLELARGRVGLAWRYEDLGRLPVGTVPVQLPRTADEAKSEFVRNGDVLLRQTLLPLNTRRRLGRFREAMDVVRAAVPLAEATVYPWYGDRSSILPYWYLQAGITAQQAGDPATARRYYLNAWTYRERDGYGHTARATAAQIALLEAFAGDMTASRMWQERAVAEARRRDLWVDRFLEALEAGAAAIHAVDALADAAVEALLPAFHPSQRHSQWPLFLWTYVQHALTLHSPTQARRYLADTVAGQATGGPVAGMAALVVPLMQAQIHLASGQANLALAALEDVPDLLGMTRALRARTLLLAGRPTAAIAAVDELTRDASASPRALNEALLVSAAAHLETGDRDAAVLAMRKVVVRVVEDDTPRVLVSIPRRVLEDVVPDVPELKPLLDLLDIRGITDLYPETVQLVALTERETGLLRDLGSELTLAEIAQAHFVSVNTVRTHLANLRKKLDARSRAEVLVKAQQLGLLDGAEQRGRDSNPR